MKNEKEKIQDFTRVAREYCQIIDALDQKEVGQGLNILAHTLPTLYLMALDLPQGDTVSEEGFETIVSHEEWQAIFLKLQGYFGEKDLYFHVFNPIDLTDDRPVAGSLSDDLSDIYRDLKEGIVRLGKASEGDIVWHWKFNFSIHWGTHLVTAMHVIHCLLFKGDIKTNDEDKK